MNQASKESSCSKLAEKIIKIIENIPSDSLINVDFASNGDIRLISNGQKWIIVSNLEVYQHRLAIDRKRPSDVSSFVEIKKNHYILDNSNVTYVKLESNERGFLDEYINNNQQRSIELNNKVELQEYFEDFDKNYQSSDYGVCLTPEKYNDFINFVKRQIDVILHVYPKQYYHIKVSIKNESLILYFAEDESGSHSFRLSFTGSKENFKTKHDSKINYSYRAIYLKMHQVVKFIKNRLGISKLKNYSVSFDSKDEVLKYLEELPNDVKIPISTNSIETIYNSSAAYGLIGASTTLMSILYNITNSSNKITNATSTALIKSVQQNNTLNDYDEPAYIAGALAALSSCFIFAGFMFYKCYFQRKKNSNDNLDIGMTELAVSNTRQMQSSSNVSVLIQEEDQTSTTSEVQPTSNKESSRSTTPLSPTTNDQGSGAYSTSSEWSTTSSPKSRSSSTPTGNEQQRLSSQGTTTESSEKLSTSAESLRSNLEKAVVESSRKPEKKLQSVYLNTCQC